MFGLQDEVAFFVEIEEIRGGGAIRSDAGDGALEDVAVLGGVITGGVRTRDLEKVTELQ